MKVEELEKVAEGRKKFSMADRVDEVQTAKRFGVSREDVRAAIADIESSRTQSIEISVTKRKEELQQYLRHVYDQLAKEWGFENMIDMMAVAHLEIVARAITNPEKYSNQGIRALKDVATLLYPPEKASMKRTLPAGDTKEKLLERLAGRLLEGQEDPRPIDLEPLPPSDCSPDTTDKSTPRCSPSQGDEDPQP